MNKTININLANTFFHIDEDAYIKLQRYLDAIKRSFTDSQGKSEIIADIEARIAELFTERLLHERQVITTKEVDEVITIMGQPEDYLVDEEIFEDEPKSSKSNTRKPHKQLFRDTDHKYIGGVCAGLSYYLGIDALWVRLLFILTTLLSGFGILVYILFWILVPEAATTAQKIAMTGEPVNISNIEKKIKEGFDEVTEKVKSVDYDKMGQSVKKNSKNFFDSILAVILFLFKVVAKLIGIIVLIFAATVLISLLIGLFTAGTIDLWGAQPWREFVDITVDAPVWLISLLSFFAVGIPFFFLFYLGLKILVNNLKSIGNFAKFSLLGIWLLSVIGLTILGIRTATDYSFDAMATETEVLNIVQKDTLEIRVMEAQNLKNRYYHDSDFDIVVDGDEKMIYREDMEFFIKQSPNNEARIEIEKKSQGSNYKDAFKRAENVDYEFSVENNIVYLNNYLTTDYDNKFRDQEIEIIIYVPENTFVKLHNSTRYHMEGNIKNNLNYYSNDLANHTWKMDNHGVLNCMDCPVEENLEDANDDVIEDSIPSEEIDTLNYEIKIDSTHIN
ncbi:putative stress-responsive transcriptional regulator [Galbibacter orientalis DSM 19592]|uniref:Putative stress-responsive transcriptional regulator n=2 Tax=Galbibacter TaxID=379068 RepID=I3C962_9FLAO|nr:PspC domain-containing protein [Galbibacter orientalis]EIJ40155.1 putative stress-responsive transcriptional regulator [Galbibacter orientalis DSM 19592]